MLINTREFSPAANHFLKYGRYCDYPEGSSMYFEYWSEQLRRCIDGYEVGGQRITGHHYYYLNFCQIKLTDNKPEAQKEKKKGGRKQRFKQVSFPHFWDGDYNFFWSLDIAFNGIDQPELDKLNLDFNPMWLDGGHHLIVAKARRRGFSYKNSSISSNIYNTVRNSLVLMCAFDKKFLFPNGIMSMAINNLEFINEHTAWSKRRQKLDKQEHKRASYLEYPPNGGQPIEKGYKSEILAISFKDNPDAARGKDASFVIFEEGGAFDNLKASYFAVKPTVENGDITTGQMIVFGTGGDMEGGTVDLESMFYNPEAYNLMPFENVWDEGAQGTTCGFFFGDLQNKVGFMDKDGNSLKKKALEHCTEHRAYIKRTAKDNSVIDKHMTEYPLQAKEAFLKLTGNIFPVAELAEHRNELMRSKYAQNIGIPGILVDGSKGVKFKPSDAVRPINKFPLDKGDDPTGAVVIYQDPYKNEDGIPDDLYLLCHDPYAFDTQTSTASLGAAYVIKMPNNFTKPDDMIVAEYIGRPASQDDYNKNLFLLSQYYNARIAFENDRGDVIGYARRSKQLHLLMPEVEIIDKSSNFHARKLGRKYGLSMGSKQRKGQALIYLRDWLLSKRSTNENGEILLNLHHIYSMVLLDELIKYDPDGNFDRVSALLVGMMYVQDHYSRGIQPEQRQATSESFFDRQFFV